MGARFFVILRYLKESMLLLQRAPCIEILAGLAKIKLDARFASKMWFNHHSMVRLSGMLLVLIIYSSYCANVCDRPIADSQQLAFADSLWMIYITIATVGFGDIVPKTHCSRFMAGCAMVGGLAVTSMLIMYISKQILFSGTIPFFVLKFFSRLFVASCPVQQNRKPPFTILSLRTNFEIICMPKPRFSSRPYSLISEMCVYAPLERINVVA
jgi:hypothetical protein